LSVTAITAAPMRLGLDCDDANRLEPGVPASPATQSAERNMRRIVLLGVCLLSTACASQLSVSDGRNNVPGVPFRAAELYLKSGWYNARADHLACTKVQFKELVSLPTGAQYFANVKPAQLAKTGFAMKFSEAGALSEISLNTEPASDAITAASNLIGQVLPLAAAATATAAMTDRATSTQPASPPCDTGAEGVEFTRFAPR
jgi:hypothetical protein